MKNISHLIKELEQVRKEYLDINNRIDAIVMGGGKVELNDPLQLWSNTLITRRRALINKIGPDVFVQVSTGNIYTAKQFIKITQQELKKLT